MDNMTALVSCFARAYHYRNSNLPVFVDPVAEQMLTAEEYDTISRNMAQGIRYFAPGFKGTPEEALLFIVNHQLAPSVLARSAFCERAIDNAVRRLGCRQVMIYACGYDTFSLRTDNQALTVYELDRPEMIADRWKRIARAGLEPACHAEAIGMRFACEYPDETNGKTHVSVITREGWLNELTKNMISWAEDKLMAEDMDGYQREIRQKGNNNAV